MKSKRVHPLLNEGPAGEDEPEGGEEEQARVLRRRRLGWFYTAETVKTQRRVSKITGLGDLQVIEDIQKSSM